MMRQNAALALVAVLAGCGNSGQTASFNRLVDENRVFFQKYNADGSLENDRTPVDALPRSGSLTYRGAALLWAGEDISDEVDNPNLADVDAAGRMRLSANMGTGAVTGTLSEFRAPAGRPPVSGRMEIDGVVSGNSFAADMRGTLTHEGQRDQTEGRLLGIFVGPQANGITGLGAGNVGAEKSFFMIYSGNRLP